MTLYPILFLLSLPLFVCDIFVSAHGNVPAHNRVCAHDAVLELRKANSYVDVPPVGTTESPPSLNEHKIPMRFEMDLSCPNCTYRLPEEYESLLSLHIDTVFRKLSDDLRASWVRTSIKAYRSCASYLENGNCSLFNDTTLCGVDDIPFPIPPQYFGLQEFFPPPHFNISYLPSGYRYPQVDFVLFVSYGDTSICSQQPGAMMYGQTCQRDFNDRPTFGRLHLCKSSLESMISRPATYRQSILHEMIHMLGFSAEKYPYFHNEGLLSLPRKTYFPFELSPSSNASYGCVENGMSRRGSNHIPPSSVFRFSMLPFCDIAPGLSLPGGVVIGNCSAQLATPLSFDLMKFLSSCPNVGGIRLQTQHRCAFPLSSHLDVLTHFEEVMSPVLHGSSRLLESLAMLEASGWYSVQFAETSIMNNNHWGVQEGCSFFNNRCQSSTDSYDQLSSSRMRRFQTSMSKASGLCTANRLAVGEVSLYQYKTHQLRNDLFSITSSSPRQGMGGALELDHCPVALPTINGDCADLFPGGDGICVEVRKLQGSSSETQWRGTCGRSLCAMEYGIRKMYLLVGSTTIQCKRGGEIFTVSIDGSLHEAECPDPDSYCGVSIRYIGSSVPLLVNQYEFSRSVVEFWVPLPRITIYELFDLPVRTAKIPPSYSPTALAVLKATADMLNLPLDTQNPWFWPLYICGVANVSTGKFYKVDRQPGPSIGNSHSNSQTFFEAPTITLVVRICWDPQEGYPNFESLEEAKNNMNYNRSLLPDGFRRSFVEDEILEGSPAEEDGHSRVLLSNSRREVLMSHPSLSTVTERTNHVFNFFMSARLDDEFLTKTAQSLAINLIKAITPRLDITVGVEEQILDYVKMGLAKEHSFSLSTERDEERSFPYFWDLATCLYCDDEDSNVKSGFKTVFLAPIVIGPVLVAIIFISLIMKRRKSAKNRLASTLFPQPSNPEAFGMTSVPNMFPPVNQVNPNGQVPNSSVVGIDGNMPKNPQANVVYPSIPSTPGQWVFPQGAVPYVPASAPVYLANVYQDAKSISISADYASCQPSSNQYPSKVEQFQTTNLAHFSQR